MRKTRHWRGTIPNSSASPFIAGMMPLAHGAGAGSQNDIGTGVIGGMITATVLAIFFVPVFFQLINRGLQHHE